MQSPTVRYSDLQLSIPILLYPIEPISERGRKFLTMLTKEFYFDVENDLAKLLEDINFDVPKTIRAKVYIINNQADYLILRKRLTNETSLLFLRCFTATAFVDYSVNKNIEGARDIVRSLFRSDKDSSSLVIYQASESLLDMYSDNIYLLFSAHQDESLLANLQNHLNNIVYKSIRANVPHASRHETKKQFFMFLSGEKEEQFRAFQHTLTKKGKFEIKAIVLEMMGLYESVHEGEIRDKKITSLLSSEKLWEFDTASTSFSNLSINSPSSNVSNSINSTNPSILVSSGGVNASNSNTNSTENMGTSQPPNLPVPPTSLASSYEDLWLFYSQAAYYYSKSQNNFKVFDCAYRLLATFDNIQLIDEAINYLLRSIEDPKVKNTSVDIQEKVSLRAWEMLSLLLSKNYQRKVPLFSYLISEKMTGNAKIDFQLQTLNFLYKQKPGDFVIRDICYPIISQLLSSGSCLNPLSKCKLALEFLSIAGPVLPLDDQDQIFHQIEDDSLGDIRIPCNLGFKTSNVQFIDRTNEVRILDSDDSSKNSKANSLFKYSFLNSGSQDNKNSCIASIGSHVSFSLDIFNPFSIALPVLICAHENDNYDSKEYPHVLQAKTFTTVHCYVVPKQASTDDQSDNITDTKITSIDVILAEGIEEVKLSEELSLTIVPNVPKFVVRTSLPIHQPMTLYDGELLNVKLWLTNNATIPIDELIVKSGNAVKGENELNLPIMPYMSANTEFDLTIDRNMTKIDLDITARTKSCKKAETFSKLVQPLKIEPAISISSIQLLKSIPEIDIDMSNLIFIAIDIKNSSDSVFNYKAHFKAAAELGFDFPGIITKKETTGVLTEFETTVFILAVEKDQILSDSIEVENSRFINARRDEEERINQKLTSQQRKVLNDRVKVTAFIENNLVFKWFCRIGRSGLLPANTALPSLDVMNEIALKRPKLIHSFDMNPLVTNKRVNLNLQFVGAKIARCALRLGMLQDPEYGIVWEGTLMRTSEQAERKEDGDVFSFQLFFTRPGHFNFKVYYESEEKVKGHTRIDFDVNENENDDNEYESDEE